MTHYSDKHKDLIFAKGHGFFRFAKNMGKNIYKMICKTLRCTWNQNLFDQPKEPVATYANNVFTDGLKNILCYYKFTYNLKLKNYCKLDALKKLVQTECT